MIFEEPIPLSDVVPPTSRIVGDPGALVSGIGHLGDRCHSMLTFAQNAKVLQRILQIAKPAAIFVREVDYRSLSTLNKHDEVVFCLANNPAEAFDTALRRVAGRILKNRFPNAPSSTYAHASVSKDAFIADGVLMGKNVIIYPGVFVGARCRIADNAILFPNAVVLEGCEIGNRSVIGAHSVIGSSPNWYIRRNEGEFADFSAIGNVVVEDDVVVGACVTIDRGITGTTRIGAGSRIGNLVQIGHESQIRRGVLIISNAAIAGNVEIGSSSTIGAQSAIANGVRVAARSILKSRAGLAQDIDLEGQTYIGFPAVPERDYARRDASLRKLCGSSDYSGDVDWHLALESTDQEKRLKETLSQNWVGGVRHLLTKNLSDQLSILPQLPISANATLKSLRADSLDIVNLQLVLEDEFSIDLTAAGITEESTISDCFYQIVRRLIVPRLKQDNSAMTKKSFLDVVAYLPNLDLADKTKKFDFHRDSGLDDYGYAILGAQLEGLFGVQLSLGDLFKLRGLADLYMLIGRARKRQKRSII